MTSDVVKVITLTDDEVSRLLAGAQINISIKFNVDSRIPDMVNDYVNGSTQQEIADKFGVSRAHVSQLLDKAITKEQRQSARQRKKIRNYAVLKQKVDLAKREQEVRFLAAVEMYLNSTKEVKEICKECKIKHGQFNTYLNDHKVPKRMRKAYRREKSIKIDEQEFERMAEVYQTGKYTTKEFNALLKEQGVPIGQFTRYLREHLIPCNSGKPRKPCWKRTKNEM